MKIKTGIFVIISILIFPACKQQTSSPPLLSFLFNNKITVILKATYASDRPLDFSEINQNTLFVDLDTNEIPNTNGMPAYRDLPIFLDIGEIRVSTKAPLIDLSLITNEKDSQDFWDVLAPFRQVYCNRIYTLNSDLNSCLKNEGLIGFELLMNGTGVTYPSRDTGSGIYTHAGIYFRSVFTGYAKTGDTETRSKFDGSEYPGYDVTKILSYDPAENTSVTFIAPQLFPLHYKTYPNTQNTVIYQEYIPAIIEFRFNLKENLMVHAFQNPNTAQTQTFVGISDWRKPHNGEPYAGGNLLLRMKIVYPVKAVDLIIDGGTYTARHYYALYYENECEDFCNEDMDLLPVSATPVRNGKDNILKDIMPGKYVLQCRYDEIFDGYPEKVVREIPLPVDGSSRIVEITLTCP